MDLLGSLSTLATNVKNVTLPGLLAAAAFALLLWPPRPYDRIPTVVDNHLNISNLKLSANEFANDSDVSLGAYLDQSGPACTVREGAESYTFLAAPFNFRQRAAVAVKNQLLLDDTDRSLNKCVEEEQALQGVDDQAIANINLLITTRTAERDGINTLYQKYILALSPMQGDFRARLECKELEIAALQAHLLNFQRIQKERARRVNQLQRLDKEMQLRMQDAGRLRPIQRFDDILSGLTSHIVGFLTLVFGWGLLIDPINRAIFSFIYDNGFDREWDKVRPSRPAPGDDARRKWEPEEDEKPPKKTAQEVPEEGHAPSSPAVKDHKFPASVDRLRSSPGWSLLVWIICGLLALLIVLLGQRPHPIKTRTIVTVDPETPADLLAPAASGADSARSSAAPDQGTARFRITVTVVAPTSPCSPNGEVSLRLRKARGGPEDYRQKLLENGVARFNNLDLDEGDYVVVADYPPADYPPADENMRRPLEGCSPFDRSTSGQVPFSLRESTTNPPANNTRCQFLLTEPEQRALTGKRGSLQFVSQEPGPDVPDVSQPEERVLSAPLIKCVLVLGLALIAGFFAPGMLRVFAPRHAAQPGPTRKKAAAFNRSKAGDTSVKLTCEQKLALNWEKLSEPQYAIGQGLITRSDFEALQNSYYSQSLVSTGLIIPLLFFIFALLVTPQLGAGQPWLYGVLGLGGVVLLITGVDRRHKYLNELDSLISSAFLKSCAQNDKSVADKKDVNLASQIADAIGKAKVLESTDWVLSVEEPPTTPPPGPTEPASGAPNPPTGSDGPSTADKNRGVSDPAASAAEILRRLTKLKLERHLTLKVPDPAASTPAPPLTNSAAPGTPTPTQSGTSQPPASKPAPKPASSDEGKE